jgi:Na+:H+ antiporter, NhaB family
MPFVSLLVVFFGVVAIIEEQHIFAPIINIVLGLPTAQQPAVRAASFFRPLFLL